MIKTFTLQTDAECRFLDEFSKNYNDVKSIVDDVYINETHVGFEVHINISDRWASIIDVGMAHSPYKTPSYTCTIYIALYNFDHGWKSGAEQLIHGITFDIPEKFKDKAFSLERLDFVNKDQIFINFIDRDFLDDVAPIDSYHNPKQAMKQTIRRTFGY